MLYGFRAPTGTSALCYTKLSRKLSQYQSSALRKSYMEEMLDTPQFLAVALSWFVNRPKEHSAVIENSFNTETDRDRESDPGL